jgi:hypothetical protein
LPLHPPVTAQGDAHVAFGFGTLVLAHQVVMEIDQGSWVAVRVLRTGR